MDIKEARNNYLESKKETDNVIDRINELVMVNGLIENKKNSLFKDINISIILVIGMTLLLSLSFISLGSIISLIPMFSFIVTSLVFRSFIRDIKFKSDGNIIRFIKDNNELMNINLNKIKDLEILYNKKNDITHEYLSVLEGIEEELLLDNDLLIKCDSSKEKVLRK